MWIDGGIKIGLGIGWIIEHEGGVGFDSLFVVANQGFHAVNFIGLTVEHKMFTTHYHIHVAV